MSIFLPAPTSLHKFGLVKETRRSRTLEYVITVVIPRSRLRPFIFPSMVWLFLYVVGFRLDWRTQAAEEGSLSV